MDITSYSLAQTHNLGEKLGQILPAGIVIALIGELGVGKTCLAQGIIRGLGVKDRYITSPTYTLINEYQGRCPIYHFDLYRLSDPKQVVELGYEEYFFGTGICIIEWAERVRQLLPESYLEITINSIYEEKRRFRLLLQGADYQNLMDKFRKIYT